MESPGGGRGDRVAGRPAAACGSASPVASASPCSGGGDGDPAGAGQDGRRRDTFTLRRPGRGRSAARRGHRRAAAPDRRHRPRAGLSAARRPEPRLRAGQAPLPAGRRAARPPPRRADHRPAAGGWPGPLRDRAGSAPAAVRAAPGRAPAPGAAPSAVPRATPATPCRGSTAATGSSPAAVPARSGSPARSSGRLTGSERRQVPRCPTAVRRSPGGRPGRLPPRSRARCFCCRTGRRSACPGKVLLGGQAGQRAAGSDAHHGFQLAEYAVGLAPHLGGDVAPLGDEAAVDRGLLEQGGLLSRVVPGDVTACASSCVVRVDGDQYRRRCAGPGDKSERPPRELGHIPWTSGVVIGIMGALPEV